MGLTGLLHCPRDIISQLFLQLISSIRFHVYHQNWLVKESIREILTHIETLSRDRAHSMGRSGERVSSWFSQKRRLVHDRVVRVLSSCAKLPQSGNGEVTTSSLRRASLRRTMSDRVKRSVVFAAVTAPSSPRRKPKARALRPIRKPS